MSQDITHIYWLKLHGLDLWGGSGHFSSLCLLGFCFSLSLFPFFSLSILSPNLTPSFLGLIENVIHKRSEKDYTYGTGYDVSGYTYFIFLRGKKPNVLNIHVSLKIFTWSLYLLASKSVVLIVLEGDLISHVQCSCGHKSVSHPRTTVWGSPLTLPLRWHVSETAEYRCQPGHALIYLRDPRCVFYAISHRLWK